MQSLGPPVYLSLPRTIFVCMAGHTHRYLWRLLLALSKQREHSAKIHAERADLIGLQIDQ